MCSLIDANKICFSYDGGNLDSAVLKDVSFKANQGDFIAIIGHNGSGKSTLAKMFNALITPTSGTMIINGIDTTHEEMIFEVRTQVGVVFQNPDNQIVATLVEEDVAFALENLCVPHEKIYNIVDESLKKVGMQDFKKNMIHNLSGGQKQRVAIAGILAMNPKCIVFDEATSMLDPAGKKELIDVMKKLNKENNTTIINITHCMEEVVFANRVIVLKDGFIFMDDEPRKIFSNEEILNQLNLVAPQVTRFMNLLSNDKLLKSEQTVLSVNECVDTLVDLLGG